MLLHHQGWVRFIWRTNHNRFQRFLQGSRTELEKNWPNILKARNPFPSLPSVSKGSFNFFAGVLGLRLYKTVYSSWRLKSRPQTLKKFGQLAQPSSFQYCCCYHLLKCDQHWSIERGIGVFQGFVARRDCSFVMQFFKSTQLGGHLGLRQRPPAAQF